MKNVDEDRTWRLGEVNISKTDTYKYLGMIVDGKGCERTKTERIARS